MKKKHIAFVVNGLYGGGAERVLQVVLANLDRQKYDITLINHREEDINYELYPAGIRYKSILKNAEKKKSKTDFFFAKLYNKINLLIYNNFSPRIFRLVYLREKFDTEIAFIEGYATRIVSGSESSKKIAWVHSDLKLCHWTNIAFRSSTEEIKCYSYFDKVASVSDSVKKSVEELFSCKSLTIYNPVDTEKVMTMSSELTIDRDEGQQLFISVGRLVPEKGYDRLISTVGKLVAEGFNIVTWIIGEGPERVFLEKLIIEWKLENSVKLLGYKNNPHPYVKAGDWAVCSSRIEGYSTAVMEALILGLPVITTLCPGMQELLGENNEWGIVVENDDLALLNGMRDILKEPSLKDRYKSLSIERKKHFSLKQRMDDIYSLIDN